MSPVKERFNDGLCPNHVSLSFVWLPATPGYNKYYDTLRDIHKYRRLVWLVFLMSLIVCVFSLTLFTLPCLVVILLNVLIAVIADSYEKATVSSAMLFGRARVTFVAQNEALEAFLKPGVNPMQAFRGIFATRTFLSRLFTLFRWFVLLAIIATACDTAIFLVILSIDAIRAQGSRDPSFLTAALRK